MLETCEEQQNIKPKQNGRILHNALLCDFGLFHAGAPLFTKRDRGYT